MHVWLSQASKRFHGGWGSSPKPGAVNPVSRVHHWHGGAAPHLDPAGLQIRLAALEQNLVRPTAVHQLILDPSSRTGPSCGWKTPAAGFSKRFARTRPPKRCRPTRAGWAEAVRRLGEAAVGAAPSGSEGDVIDLHDASSGEAGDHRLLLRLVVAGRFALIGDAVEHELDHGQGQGQDPELPGFIFNIAASL
ncbi:hypothetical protein PG999_004046 [Apiospora kogelbergensis]|uniref:Uncharacterized protein n=1 Tax=Apiospora kogelbergensis TaxID=1337665 RepID=A0AAW0R560_9PEZI